MRAAERKAFYMEGKKAHERERRLAAKARAQKDKHHVIRKGSDINPYAGERSEAWIQGWNEA